jgi:hypothetical protein
VTGDLGPGASETETWTWSATEGNHDYQICADSGAAIAESNEGNNCTALIPFTVDPAPPPPSNFVDLAGWLWMDLPQSVQGAPEGAGWIHLRGSNYGVSVENATGLMFGHAWSENFGWLSFEQGDLSGCPSAPCEARFNPDRSLSGWARFINAPSGDWEGWVHLRGLDYGVSYNATSSEYMGWAWAGEVGGWISWNCANPELGLGCSQSDYRATSSPPNTTPPDPPSNLIVQDPDHCLSALQYTFSWTFTDPDVDDTQWAYQLQIDTDSGFSGGLTHDTGKTLSPSHQYTLPPGVVIYNRTYYWRVRVWDRGDNMSDWSLVDSFTTPVHAYPDADFSWDPPAPSLLEKVDFFDESSAASSLNIDSWSWTFQDASPSASSIPDPQDVVFATGSQTKLVTLTVSDDSAENYSCTEQKSLFFKPPLP